MRSIFLRASSAALLLAASACAPARPTAVDQPVPTAAGSTSRTLSERVYSSLPATTESGGVSETLAVAADTLYSVLDEAYAALGIEVRTASSRDRTMGNTSFTATRRVGNRPLTEYVRCSGDALGGSLASATKPVRISVLTTVTPAGESSRLTTHVVATTSASERAGDVPCTSTGMLEEAISAAAKRAILQAEAAR